MKFRCIRSYAGQYRAGMGDVLDEIPPGVSPYFFEVIDVDSESAMLPSAPPRKTGVGNLPVIEVKGVGKATARALEAIGVKTVVDLAAADEDAVSPKLIDEARRMLT